MIWLLVPAAFLLGSVPFGLLIGRRYGVDIRQVGSGNIGATNVWRACGPGPGICALLLDVAKGALPTLAARLLAGDQPWLHISVGAAAVLGHSFSPWLGFRGGKGVATSLGFLLVLHPLGAGVAVGLFLLLVKTTGYVSLGSMIGCLAAAIVAQATPTPPAYRVVLWGLVVLIWVRHRANLSRLLRGEENRFGGQKPAAVEPSATAGSSTSEEPPA